MAKKNWTAEKKMEGRVYGGKWIKQMNKLPWIYNFSGKSAHKSFETYKTTMLVKEKIWDKVYCSY